MNRKELIEIASKIMECEMAEELTRYSGQAAGKVLVEAMELSASEWETKTGLPASARPDWVRDMVREFDAWSHVTCDDEDYYAWEAYFQSVADGAEDPEMIRAFVDTKLLDPTRENRCEELPVEVYLSEGGTDADIIDLLLPRNEQTRMVFSTRIAAHQEEARRLSRQAAECNALAKRLVAEFDARGECYRYPEQDASNTSQN